jgi:hypothetical protein
MLEQAAPVAAAVLDGEVVACHAADSTTVARTEKEARSLLK